VCKKFLTLPSNTIVNIDDQKGLAPPEINDLERVWTLPKSVSSQIFQDLEGVLTFDLLLRIKLQKTKNKVQIIIHKK